MNNLSPSLFFSKKERLVFLLFLIAILSCTLSYKYYQFHTLKSQKSTKIEANVLLQYTKMRGDKSYYVLKLQSNFGTFYTTSWEDLKNLKNKELLCIVEGNSSEHEFFYAARDIRFAPQIDGEILINDKTIDETIQNGYYKVKITEILGEDIIGCIVKKG